jgi:beta-xylosidase
VDRFPGGRIPVLAPITWDANGWPNVQFGSPGKWGTTYAYPLPKRPVKPVTGTDVFNGTALGPQYEWNHNPDNTKWSVGQGLTLQTATKTDDFFMARNTLSHRILGPKSSATIQLDISGMVDGDKAGLATFRYDAAWIGVAKSGATATVQMVDNVLMGDSGGWHTTNKGTVVASQNLSGNSVWLRCTADISSGAATSRFSYSIDGKTFTDVGGTHRMADGAVFFVGDRYGIFNFGTKNLGGKVVVNSFTLAAA